MHSKMTSLQKQLERLQKTSIISDIFKISSVDDIATIGGYRLGKTQRVDVPWDEINAAIGQLVYLLCVLAHRLGFKFERYYLHVNGAYSKISLSNKPKTKYELFYGQSEAGFNTGMTQLLQCVKAFIEWIVSKQLDKLIEKEGVKKCQIGGPPNDFDKIEQSSIMYNYDSKEQWTRACKCLLMNVQWICVVCKFYEDQNQIHKNQQDAVHSTLKSSK